jgi:hypothetical protein
MVRIVTITRWTPETARAIRERWNTIVKGTAPKVVLDAFAKIKIITNELSLPNRLGVMVYEIAEKDIVEVTPVSLYMQDVCTQEEYVVVSMEDYLAVQEKLPTEKIPKPEQWYRTK